jgi:uncharacterized DUF497 family protein
MIFEWDEAKRRRNLRKHGVDFVDAAEVLAGPTATREDSRDGYGERRYVSLGLLHEFVVQLVYTEHGDVVRVISLRKATRRETKDFYAQIID